MKRHTNSKIFNQTSFLLALTKMTSINAKSSKKQNQFLTVISMALEKTISWLTLASILEEMISDISESKQLIRILLKELQASQMKLDCDVGESKVRPAIMQDNATDIENFDINYEEEMPDIEREELSYEGIQNEEPEIIEEAIEDIISENKKVENKPEVNPHGETYNLKDFYTYVDNSKSKSKEIEDMTSGSEHMEDFTNTQEYDASSNHSHQDSEIGEIYSKRIIQERSNKKFECDICLKSFSTKKNKVLHKRIHTNEKPYECKTCKMKFAWESNLIQHERIHSGEKPFECKQCKKGFTQQSYLKVHERSHSGEKPFECKVCSKSFRQLIHLKNHQRTHTGEKPFECRYCKKDFTKSYGLKIHERIHDGEKPFQCKYCKKGFTQSPNLQVHERTHTGEVPFRCMDCGKRFKFSNELSRHKKKTHKKSE